MCVRLEDYVVVLVRLEIVLYVLIVRVCYVGVFAMVCECGFVDMVCVLYGFACVYVRACNQYVLSVRACFLLFSSSFTFRHLLHKFIQNPNSIEYEH